MKNIDDIRDGESFNAVSTTNLMDLALKLIPEERCRLKDSNYSKDYVDGMIFGMTQLAIKAAIDKDALMTVNINKSANTEKSHECQCDKKVEASVEAFRKKVLEVLDFHSKTLRNTKLAVKATNHRVYQESGENVDSKLGLLIKLKSEIEKLQQEREN